MLLALVQRLSSRRPVAAAAPSTRPAVCPPTLAEEITASGWLRAWQRLRTTGGERGGLLQARSEFAEALADIGSQHAEFLRSRASRARSLLELWHMRTEAFQLLALHHTEHEAARRMAALSRHFPARSSAFAPLDA